MISFDKGGLENGVESSLSNTQNYLENANRILQAITIPASFSCMSLLRSMPTEVTHIYNNVKSYMSWVKDIVDRFKNLENENKNIINNSFLNLFGEIDFSSGLFDKELLKEKLKQKENNLKELFSLNSLANELSGFFDILFSSNNEKIANQTGSTVSEDVGLFFLDLIKTGSNIASNVNNFFQNDLLNFINDFFTETISFIGGAVDCLYENVLQPIGNFVSTTAATVGNVGVSLVKGLSNLGESLFDGAVILGTGAGTVLTGAWDGITYVGSVLTGDTENWQSATEEMWSNTMSFVTENHVENAFSDFYENNFVGQWLDENAIDIFKSNGIGSNIVSGVGYVGGLIGLSLLTGGLAGALAGTSTVVTAGSTTLISSILATIGGLGEGTESFWGEKKASSIEGIEELHNKGEISDEEYNSIVTIRNLTDDEWNKIKEDYENGNISQEQFEMMKEIREIPEDWKNLDNLLSGLGYGAAVGTWEGIQWYLGGKLIGLNIAGNQGLTSATRVIIDSLFNAGDTPFRAIAESVATGEDFNETFKKYGGTDAMLTNFTIGLIGSVGGEAFDIHNTNKVTQRLDSMDIWKNLDDSTTTKIKDIIKNDNRNGNININKMSDIELNKYVSDFVTKRNTQINEAIKFIYGENNDLIFSSTREKIEDGIDIINSTKMLENIDENLGNIVRNKLIRDYIDNKIDLRNISSSNIEKYIFIETQIENVTKYLYGDRSSLISDFVRTKIEDGVDAIDKSGMLNNLDEATATKIRNSLMLDYFRKKINLEDLSSSSYINKYIRNRQEVIDNVTKFLYGDRSTLVSDFVRTKIEDGVDTINKSQILDNLDETTANNIRNLIMRDYFKNKISLEDLANSTYRNEYLKKQQTINNIMKDMYGNDYDVLSINEKIIDKIIDGVSEIDKTSLLNSLDENVALRVKISMIEAYFSDELSKNDLSDSNCIKTYILKEEEIQKINTIILSDTTFKKAQDKLEDINKSFEMVYGRNNVYGTDQGIFKALRFKNPSYYNELVQEFSTKYNMSKATTINIMKYLDSIGACSYADVCNVIISEFINNTEKYEEVFGTTLFNTTYGGFNSEELLFDMYVWKNSVENGGKLFEIDSTTGKRVIVDNLKGDKFSTQEYMTQSNNLQKYIESKTDTIDVNEKTIELNRYNENGIKNLIVEAVNKGEQVSLSISGEITYTDVKTGVKSQINGAHITKIVGITDDKVIVQTWGKKCYIPLSDIGKNNRGILYIRDINIK